MIKIKPKSYNNNFLKTQNSILPSVFNTFPFLDILFHFISNLTSTSTLVLVEVISEGHVVLQGAEPA